MESRRETQRSHPCHMYDTSHPPRPETRDTHTHTHRSPGKTATRPRKQEELLKIPEQPEILDQQPGAGWGRGEEDRCPQCCPAVGYGGWLLFSGKRPKPHIWGFSVSFSPVEQGLSKPLGLLPATAAERGCRKRLQTSCCTSPPPEGEVPTAAAPQWGPPPSTTPSPLRMRCYPNKAAVHFYHICPISVLSPSLRNRQRKSWGRCRCSKEILSLGG